MWLLLLACTNPCSSRGEPTLELGHGATSFAPAASPQTVELVAGNQGAYHVDLAIQATGLEGDDLISAVFTGTVDGDEVAIAERWLDMTCDESTGVLETWGIRLVVFDLGALDGPLEVEARVRDDSGDTAEASETYIVDFDPPDTGLDG